MPHSTALAGEIPARYLCRMAEQLPDELANALAAHRILGWRVFLHHEDRSRIVGGVPPGENAKLCPIPPFTSNFKAAMKLRDCVALLPADRRAVFLEELHKLVAEALRAPSVPGPELILWASPRDVTLAALKAVPSKS